MLTSAPGVLFKHFK